MKRFQKRFFFFPSFSLPTWWKVFLPAERKIHKNVGQTSSHPIQTCSSLGAEPAELNRPAFIWAGGAGPCCWQHEVCQGKPGARLGEFPSRPERGARPYGLLLISCLPLLHTQEHNQLTQRLPAAHRVRICSGIAAFFWQKPQPLRFGMSPHPEASGCLPFPFLGLTPRAWSAASGHLTRCPPAPLALGKALSLCWSKSRCCEGTGGNYTYQKV